MRGIAEAYLDAKLENDTKLKTGTKLESDTKLKQQRKLTVIMANTKTLGKEERKKTKRASRKKDKAEKPKKPRDYARGSKKRTVKKLARGQAKR